MPVEREKMRINSVLSNSFNNTKINSNNKINHQTFNSNISFGNNIYDKRIQMKSKTVLKESETVFKDANKVTEKSAKLIKEVEEVKKEAEKKAAFLQNLYNSKDPRLTKMANGAILGAVRMVDYIDGYERISDFMNDDLIGFQEEKDGKTDLYSVYEGSLYKYLLGVAIKKDETQINNKVETSVFIDDSGYPCEIILGEKESFDFNKIHSKKFIKEFYHFKNGIVSDFSKNSKTEQKAKDPKNPEEFKETQERTEFDENGLVESHYKNLQKTSKPNNTHVTMESYHKFQNGKLKVCIKGSDITKGLIGDIQHIDEFYTFVSDYLTSYQEDFYSVKDDDNNNSNSTNKKFTS